MATGQMSEVIQHLRRAMFLQDVAGLIDGQLLKDYISRRAGTTLAALVKRHAPMVWSVCRRVLSNYHDGHDKVPVHGPMVTGVPRGKDRWRWHVLALH
jgi:RNA polymerase sigma-70 factor (ECF subfamily)